jgi:Bifunctional DNA primase/polymerase, N-terminal
MDARQDGHRVSRLDSALAYTRRGFKVFPVHWIYPDGFCSCRKKCSSPGKHPIETGWRGLATVDEGKIRRWWSRNPEANIGVACGKDSNCTAMDVDVKGIDGCEALRILSSRTASYPRAHARSRGAGVITTSTSTNRACRMRSGVRTDSTFATKVA